MTGGQAGERNALALLTDPGEVREILAGLLGSDAPDTFTLGPPQHRAGAGVSICVQLARPARPDTVVLTSLPGPTGPGVVELTRRGLALRAWRLTEDPHLPGLAQACDPVRVAGWLGETHVELHLHGYRPTRRAVISATGSRTWFLKVLDAAQTEQLRRRHLLLAAYGVPAPVIAATPLPGVTALETARGEPLNIALSRADGEPAAAPDPAALRALLDRLPTPLLELPRQSSWVDRLDAHAGAAGAHRPALAGEIERLRRGIAGVLAARDAGPLVPTHGDFHTANVFCSDGVPSGLIDVDSVGPGHRADDLATMLGHLASLPALGPQFYGAVPRFLERCWADFSHHADPVGLAARTAAVVLSLVSGAEPAQADERVRLAGEWLARARAVEAHPAGG